jgi:hypothetical protein
MTGVENEGFSRKLTHSARGAATNGQLTGLSTASANGPSYGRLAIGICKPRNMPAQSVPALGPYPSRGDYEHSFTLETPRGEFIQLTATIAAKNANPRSSV